MRFDFIDGGVTSIRHFQQGDRGAWATRQQGVCIRNGNDAIRRAMHQ